VAQEEKISSDKVEGGYPEREELLLQASALKCDRADIKLGSMCLTGEGIAPIFQDGNSFGGVVFTITEEGEGERWPVPLNMDAIRWPVPWTTET
jgi:hypothetical protein